MNLHEYQAKELFREYGIAVSEGLSASSSEEVIDKAKSLNVDKWVVRRKCMLVEEARLVVLK